MPPYVKLVSSLFGVVEPAPLNTSESPVATGPEPEEYVQFAVVLKLIPVPPTHVSVETAKAVGASSSSSTAKFRAIQRTPARAFVGALLSMVFILIFGLSEL